MLRTSEINRGYDLLAIASRDTALKKVGRYYIGPCPFCGGKDRLNIKRTSGGDLWICRQCGKGKYDDAISYIMRRQNCNFVSAIKFMGSEDMLSDPKSLEAREKLDAEAKARAAEIDKKLADYTTKEIWEALHRRLETDETHRKWWRAQGIPDIWQDYLRLGYTPEKKYYSGDELCVSPAYSIPYFHHDKEGKDSKRFVTMQYRLSADKPIGGKYRFEFGLGTSFYDTTPTIPVDDMVIITEGAKKAIVTKLYAGNGITVLGIPSKQDRGNVEEAVLRCNKVWVALDPDATDHAFALANDIGRNARVVELPMKIDDALNKGALNKNGLVGYLRQGVKV